MYFMYNIIFGEMAVYIFARVRQKWTQVSCLGSLTTQFFVHNLMLLYLSLVYSLLLLSFLPLYCNNLDDPSYHANTLYHY